MNKLRKYLSIGTCLVLVGVGSYFANRYFNNEYGKKYRDEEPISIIQDTFYITVPPPQEFQETQEGNLEKSLTDTLNKQRRQGAPQTITKKDEEELLKLKKQIEEGIRELKKMVEELKKQKDSIGYK